MEYKIFYTVVFIAWLYFIYCTHSGLKDRRFRNYTKKQKIASYILGPIIFVAPVYLIGLVVIFIWS